MCEDRYVGREGGREGGRERGLRVRVRHVVAIVDRVSATNFVSAHFRACTDDPNAGVEVNKDPSCECEERHKNSRACAKRNRRDNRRDILTLMVPARMWP